MSLDFTSRPCMPFPSPVSVFPDKKPLSSNRFDDLRGWESAKCQRKQRARQTLLQKVCMGLSSHYSTHDLTVANSLGLGTKTTLARYLIRFSGMAVDQDRDKMRMSCAKKWILYTTQHLQILWVLPPLLWTLCEGGRVFYPSLTLETIHIWRPVVRKMLGFFDPLPPCPYLGLIYSTKFTQPPLLHLLLG